jgi:predicted metal-dependent phosphoesterase TrpH
VHSTASDGECTPEEVVARAARVGLAAFALSDHDTLDGLPAALEAAGRVGIRLINGCEFSVAAVWGEMHLLAYFLPLGVPELERFLVVARADRARRGAAMAARLQRIGIPLTEADVEQEAAGASVGRPHVARALVKRGYAADVGDAFDRYLGRGRPGFVEKELPTFRAVADLVHSVGGVVSAAHLRERGTRSLLERLKAEGLDGVEVRHPRHDANLRARLSEHARLLGLARTGGSDWHGDGEPGDVNAGLGSQQIPLEWLERLEAMRPPPPVPAG